MKGSYVVLLLLRLTVTLMLSTGSLHRPPTTVIPAIPFLSTFKTPPATWSHVASSYALTYIPNHALEAQEQWHWGSAWSWKS